MEIQTKRPSVKGTPDRFVGDVWLDPIADDQGPSRVRSSVVHFAPGARNAWHAHALGQTLHVIEGIGRTQARGGEVVEIRAGDTIHASPGEWHWHGAAPDHFMSHLVVYESPADGPETEWGEHVTDED
jgi:quercetin dioxygenase-like cupin family protein